MRRASWTEGEHAHLAAFYPYISAKNLQRLLPGRTPKAIRQEAFDLGLRKCDQRVREYGRENVLKRWYPEPPAVFKDPAQPEQ